MSRIARSIRSTGIRETVRFFTITLANAAGGATLLRTRFDTRLSKQLQAVFYRVSPRFPCHARRRP